MFGLFKKTSEIDKLQKQYEKLMADWHKLSTTNRAASDEKYSEAEKVLTKIEALKS
ncbi:MAG: Lacal_2735 family protein [Winogradskyella sp.]|uniref:Lacal_2735 family protein n=1 Tax=Winogradskyella sp. TaxID=1883156 RepID=UPI001792767D|nr:Lacal_2735 family protein [Winogradskyella sp.]MBT8245165.1 Lacal_2735 family protein [Winogradskyella sp.]NNK22559.1 Lacal_2735 family protein [Winogradskyella sp.]